MITVTFYIRGPDIIGFKCNGHAGYAEHGKDIVCAGVSTCLIGAANEIQLYCEAEVKTGNGNLYVVVDEANKASEVLMCYALHTMQSIEKEHPEYVNVVIKS